MTSSVLVLGGGVGGMSAAHELIERGFSVTVLEHRAVPGGKARSLLVPDSAVPPNAPLPGEHGFRFFPHFYRHIIDTMARTPLGDGRVASDKLVYASREMMALSGLPPITFPAHKPNSIEEWVADLLNTLKDMPELAQAGLVESDFIFFADRIWRLMTSCPGPTSQVWINAWHDYLAGRSVVFQYECTVSGFDCSAGRISGVHSVAADGSTAVHHADYYLCALPVEYTARLLTPGMLAADPSLKGIQAIAGHVYDMTGIQFYLVQDVSLTKGHILLVDSPWALTGISQRQFWPGIDFTQIGDGSTQGILSIDISDWDAEGVCVVNPALPPGADGKPHYKTARQCTQDEVALEVWTQLRQSLTQADGSCLLPPQQPRYFIDPGMVFNPTPVSNDSRLFVNRIGTWALRPDAATKIPNFFLASDYVRTNTNLATMESANEAARRAVNALLEAAGVNAPPSRIWALPVPEVLQPFIDFDKLLWHAGKGWTGKTA